MLPVLLSFALAVSSSAAPRLAPVEVTSSRSAFTAPAAGAHWPLAPVPDVVRGYDPPELRWGSGHRGVDLSGRLGQAVGAALPGRVAFVGTVAGTPVVVLDHGGFETTYQPVLATVDRGQQVAAGEQIGVLTWAGSHCLPHVCLHWGLRRGRADEVSYRDPLTLVADRPRPVRLLPLGDAS